MPAAGLRAGVRFHMHHIDSLALISPATGLSSGLTGRRQRRLHEWAALQPEPPDPGRGTACQNPPAAAARPPPSQEMSKRKTPAMVAFVNGERLVGEEAASLAARFPERVYMGLKDTLGRPHDDEHVVRVLKEKYLPYDLVPPKNSSSLAIRTHTGEVYSAEEVVVSAGKGHEQAGCRLGGC